MSAGFQGGDEGAGIGLVKRFAGFAPQSMPQVSRLLLRDGGLRPIRVSASQSASANLGPDRANASHCRTASITIGDGDCDALKKLVA